MCVICGAVDKSCVSAIDQAAIRSHRQLDQRFEPAMDQSERERRCYDWRRAVKRSKGWIESS
ncbi:MAG: hypothetical protein EA377_01640 [Phycisphaerales bacterium]|nr:MAG: hypothetical protein EA377_01640 [Phycisphaerales bacterium]